jgi:hypothetical protein
MKSSPADFAAARVAMPQSALPPRIALQTHSKTRARF